MASIHVYNDIFLMLMFIKINKMILKINNNRRMMQRVVFLLIFLVQRRGDVNSNA